MTQPQQGGNRFSPVAKLETLGGFGLYLYFLSFQLNATVAYIGLSMLVLVFAFQATLWMPVLKHDRVAWLFSFIVAFILLYSIWAAQEFPETKQAQRTASFLWLHWLMFIPVGWQLSRQRKQLNRLLATLAIGLMIRIVVNFNWAELGTLRTGFGMAETVFAPIAGTMALGLLMLAPRTLNPSNTPRWVAWLNLTACGIGLVIFLEALVLSQTRGVWLAAALVFPVALLVRYKSWLASHAKFSVKSLIALLVLGFVAILFVQKNYVTILNRVNSEQIRAEPEVVKKQIEGQDIMLTTSTGYRKILWGIGWRKWQERRLLGWGPGSTENLIIQESNPLLSQSITLKDGSTETLHLYHLHSLYLELLVRFGVLGTGLLIALPLLLLSNVGKAYIEGMIPWDYTCFLFAGWALLAIMVASDFQLFKFAWRNYCVIWAALTYAVQFPSRNLDTQQTRL